MFTPEEAELAAVMHLYREEVPAIAERAGVDDKIAYKTLKQMARKGLVRVGKGERRLSFGLLPFVVGSYEEALPYLDNEMAELFEDLMQETQGEGLLGPGPAIERVIPVEQSIDAGIDVLPYEALSELIKDSKSFGIRECICRKQKDLVGEPCEHERFNCVSFAPIEGAFAHAEHIQDVSREEAVRVLRESEETGLVHTVKNQQKGIYYVCNCCPCCCGIMRGIVEFGHAHALARSDFLATVDADECIGCEACAERCHVNALSVPNDICVVDAMRCIGCGLCVGECATEALRLVRREAEESQVPPVSHRDWQEERAVARGVPLEELL
jgi:ferredoxin